MIGSSQVDLVCWTERVCRDCREALTTVTLEEPAGSRNVRRSREPRDAVSSEICANYPGNPCRTLQ
jgi:hypothetical protein